MNRVLFAGGGTGGHLYPALNLADALRAERPEAAVHFVGARRGIEARVLPERGAPHTLLPLEPLRRDRVWRNWRLLPAAVGGARGLHRLFRAFSPALVVGTGGYASGPACVWALLRGVPVALQEQNSYPGLTTRELSRWARQVHLGFPEAEQHLRTGRATRVFVLGNPIRPPDRTVDRREGRRALGLPERGTVLLVVGGSQGARAINDALADALEGVARGSLAPRPRGLHVLWATGPSHVDGIRAHLAGTALEAWVTPVGYIDRMDRALAAADLALSRAGAMATAEFLAWGVPAVLVPLPTAAADHQSHNARALDEAGAAIHLPQPELTPERLWHEVAALAVDAERRAAMAKAAQARARPDAARRIVRRLLEVVEA
ncbi:MAG: undecaprenyldiphospho-muramoylpentapeptide beta-N-acetylglucosaminyltransferase [Gemmatimonadota bacterium]